MISKIKSWYKDWNDSLKERKHSNQLADMLAGIYEEVSPKKLSWYGRWKKKRNNRNFMQCMRKLYKNSSYEDYDIKDIMKVQPMTEPTDTVFYMDFVYSKKDSDALDREEFEYAKKKLLDQYNSEKVHEPIKELNHSNVKEQRYISDDGRLVIYRYDNGAWYALAGRAGFVLFDRGIPVGYVGTRMS